MTAVPHDRGPLSWDLATRNIYEKEKKAKNSQDTTHVMPDIRYYSAAEIWLNQATNQQTH